MSEKLTCENNIIYAFDKDTPPVKHVKAGDQLTIETYDCFTNQIKSEDMDLGDSLDWNKVNPATGPVYVEGAEPGDILKVTIDKLEVGSEGFIVTGPGVGVFGDQFDTFHIKKLPIENDHAIFDGNLKIPLQKMIGVIGVAPEEGPINCGTPGAHGGNMDTTLVTEGATLYFPVFHKGALFATGDFHGVMGDGEVAGSGMEIPGEVTVTFDIIKGHKLNYPLIENDEGIAFIVTKETLDEAAKNSAQEMIYFLKERTDLSLPHLTILMSAVGHSQVSQIVNPLTTARFFLPKYVLENYDVKLFNE